MSPNSVPWRSQLGQPIGLQGVSLRFRRPDYGSDVEVFRNISLEVLPGELACLRGPSGCGKSSLLFVISGLLRPSAGRVFVFDQNLGSLSPWSLKRFRRRHIHLVPQGVQLIPHLNVLENLLAVQYFQGRLDRKGAQGVLKALDLPDKSGCKPAQLSGGERQRLCVAQGLASPVPLLLLDEPTAHLDSESSLLVTRSLQEQCRRGRTVLVTTQDRRFRSYATREIRMADLQQ